MTTHPIPAAQLAWLRGEVRTWQDESLIDSSTGTAIIARYSAAPAGEGPHQRRASVTRIFSILGGAFVGVGLIWLVAANLDQFSPLLRFLLITTIWAGLTIATESLAARRTSLLVGGLRFVSALAFGAVIFQAAQSLQLPEYSPHLIGLWSLGALLYAYAVRSFGALLVGVITFAVWVLSAGLWIDASFLESVLLLTLLGLGMIAYAALQDRSLPAFAWAWRHAGVGFALIGLFAAGVPAAAGSLSPTWVTWALVVASVALGLLALLRGSNLARFEVLGAVTTIAVAFTLALWETGDGSSQVSVADWAHAALCVAAYVALALSVAVLGTLRKDGLLTGMAAAALVVFTTFQSFAVFARIIQGAWLFLVLGLIFMGTAWLFDRTRKVIAAELQPPDGGDAGRAIAASESPRPGTPDQLNDVHPEGNQS